MMETLSVEICPETGICSIGRNSTEKIDLMPDEVADIVEAAGSPERIKAVITQCDAAFAAGLSSTELAQIARQVR
jgi:hypothetical protein